MSEPLITHYAATLSPGLAPSDRDFDTGCLLIPFFLQDQGNYRFHKPSRNASGMHPANMSN